MMITLFTLIHMFYSVDAKAIELVSCKNASGEKAFERCLQEFSSLSKTAGVVETRCESLEESGTPCPPLTEDFAKKSGDNCNQFISETGAYGKWGNEIIAYLDEQGDDSIFFEDDLDGMKNGVKACPAWTKMNLDERKHFWVWTMASIANIESECKPTARGSVNPNGISVGLLQLDERASFRKWRGPNCGGKTITDVKANLRCGMDIMGELLRGKKGEYKSSGQLWGKTSSSYWNHLRQKDGGDISDLITQNPFCTK